MRASRIEQYNCRYTLALAHLPTGPGSQQRLSAQPIPSHGPLPHNRRWCLSGTASVVDDDVRPQRQHLRLVADNDLTERLHGAGCPTRRQARQRVRVSTICPPHLLSNKPVFGSLDKFNSEKCTLVYLSASTPLFRQGGENLQNVPSCATQKSAETESVQRNAPVASHRRDAGHPPPESWR